ncbi:WD40/YVTN/BNR-like repeat-containing protein [Pedobacter frigoris]|uniref:WD40/YVTN/BNR-like repeat-containing protein n=1 Tax=Pedobacter frigoris TaxID=2571272 RepID=UPI00292E73BB|nr:YCF48-related protein [Pedobacter frigoris]
MIRYLISLFVMLPFFGNGQVYNLVPVNQMGNASFRGMSIVSDQVAWVSGSNGTIGRTVDGGKTWQQIQPKGYEKLDFRDIEAFDKDRAVTVNAGSPAYVLVTSDGGASWKEVYKNVDSAIFLDGMGFWDNKNGIIFGDPINNKMQLLKTRDGGLNWQDVSGNLKSELSPGEAGFAASGTTIRTAGKGKVWIATGGSVSNIYFSDNYGYSWSVFKCPIWQGENSTGPFSIDFYDQKTGVAVGGNYLKDKENPNNILLTADGGKTWEKPQKPVEGFRSGVLYVNKKTLLATGTSGTDVSNDGGKNWHKISDLSFNVVQKARKGSLILIAGNKGQIYQLKISDDK